MLFTLMWVLAAAPVAQAEPVVAAPGLLIEGAPAATQQLLEEHLVRALRGAGVPVRTFAELRQAGVPEADIGCSAPGGGCSTSGNVGAVVLGALRQQGEHFTGTLELRSAPGGRVLWTRQVDAENTLDMMRALEVSALKMAALAPMRERGPDTAGPARLTVRSLSILPLGAGLLLSAAGAFKLHEASLTPPTSRWDLKAHEHQRTQQATGVMLIGMGGMALAMAGILALIPGPLPDLAVTTAAHGVGVRVSGRLP